MLIIIPGSLPVYAPGQGIMMHKHFSQLFCLKRTREGDERPGGTVTATSDVDLGAGDVELGSAERRCDMQSNLLHANKVLPTGKGLGEGEAYAGHA